MTTAVDVTPVPEYTKQGEAVFDFDDETLVDDSIQQVMFTKSFDIAGPPAEDKEYFMFQQNDLMSNYLWSRSFLKIKFEVRQSTPLANCTTTSDLRTLFRRVRCTLGGQVLFDMPDYFWMYATQDYTWWTKQYLDTVGSSMLTYPDTNRQIGTGQYNDNVLLYVGNNNTALDWSNSGLCGQGFRWEYEATATAGSDDGNIISCYIPLYHMIPALQYMDRCVQGLQFQLELWKSDNAIHMSQAKVGAANSEVNWRGNGIELWCRRIIPTSTYKLVLQEKMNKGLDMTVKYPQPNVYRFGMPNTESTLEMPVTVTASRPLHAIIMFQDARAIEDPNCPTDYFDHANIQSIAMYINGIKVPQEGINQELIEAKINNTGGTFDVPPPYVFGETTVQAQNSYYWYLKHAGQFRAPYLNNFQEGSGCLTFTDWKNKMPIYSFDLSTHEIGSWSGGASQINFRFTRSPNGNTSQPIPNYSIWVVLWTEATLGIHLENFNNYCTNT